MDIHQGGGGAEERVQPGSAAPKTLQEVRDDIEAALFAVQDLSGSGDSVGREKAIIATKLEEAFLWAKRAIEKEGSG